MTAMSHQPSSSRLGDPQSSQEVIRWLEIGRLPPEHALRQLRELDPRLKPENTDDLDTKINAVMDELDHLVGLGEVKRLVMEIRAFVEIQQLRNHRGLASEAQMLHMVFKGAPGTGKTTVARIIGKLFQTLEVLPKGHLVEVERADLVGEYIGHTAQKCREVIKRAMGGVLFVDEAYSLARGGDKDFGKEAIDTLVKAMEDHKSEFLLILAGYPNEMRFFLNSNPGLMSRFPIHIEFPDYSPTELLAIGRRMVEERQYRLSPEAEQFLTQWLSQEHAAFPTNAGNARMVRNLIERSIRRQAVRLVTGRGTARLSRDELMGLTRTDVEGAL